MMQNSPAATAAKHTRPAADVAAEAREQLRRARLRGLDTDRRLQTVLESEAWQAAVLARRIARRVPGLSRLGLRLFKLLAWTLLGELGDRRRSRRLRRERTRRDAPLAPQPRPPIPEHEAESLPPPPPGPGGQTILIVDASVPQTDRNAGARTTAAFISAFLEAGWSVSFAAFDGLDAGDYTRALSAAGVRVVDDRVSGGLRVWLAAHGRQLDHVMLMRPRPARALLPLVLACTRAHISYYGHDLHFARLRQEAVLSRDVDLRELAARELAIERQIWRAVDVVLYPSPAEAALVSGFVPGAAVAAVPAFAFEDFPPSRPPPNGATLLFVGNFAHQPNEDAAAWFAEAVFPRVRAVRPDGRFVIAGSGPTARVRALAGDAIEVTGYLTEEALRRQYETARVVVVPLRFGAGVKGKVVEAMRNGVPVVTTAVGAEGMPGVEAAVTVCEEPAAMAEAITRLIADHGVWTNQVDAAIAYVRRHFSRDALREALLGAVIPATATAAQVASSAEPNTYRSAHVCKTAH